MYSVTPSRSYRDGDAWKNSHSCSYDEIVNFAKILLGAQTFITTLRAKERTMKPAGGTKTASPPGRIPPSERPA